MKKTFLLIFISAITFLSCEKDFTGVIDYEVNTYQVTTVSPSGNILFNAQDSLIIVRIDFTASSKVSQIGFDIISSTNEKLNAQRILLYDNGLAEYGDNTANDNKFANKFPLSSYYPVGTYSIRYYVTDNSNHEKLIAQSSFVYDNGQNNVAPVISNLTAPGSVTIGSDTTFIFLSIDVFDQNGLNDIDIVFFNSFIPPNGLPSSSNPIRMFDDGTNGDQVPNDGTYSRVVILPPTGVTLGTYRWEFQSKDRGGLLSNIIIHNVEIQ